MREFQNAVYGFGNAGARVLADNDAVHDNEKFFRDDFLFGFGTNFSFCLSLKCSKFCYLRSKRSDSLVCACLKFAVLASHCANDFFQRANSVI